MLQITAAITLALLSNTSAAPTIGKDSLVGRYFGQDWAQTGQPSATAHQSPVAKPAPAPAPDAGKDPMHDDHSPIAHMWITRKAYELYVSQYDGGELSQYIGDSIDSKPDSAKEDTVVEGSFEEDKPFRNPWNQMISEMRHFWGVQKGPYIGLWGCDSAVNRATKYFTGGYGMDGAYDSGWSENSGKDHGTKDQGILALYRGGNKAKAFWYLGHAAHLLEDMTVPAHTLLWPHPLPNSDAYETYMKTHHQNWSAVPSAALTSFDTLYDLFFHTADVTDDYDAGFGGGDNEGLDGKVDRGQRRQGGFTEKKLIEEGNVLMPLAYERVAELYVYFFKQVDHTPPRVSLSGRVQGRVAVLQAEASDSQSGVKRNGFRFEYAVWTGRSWSDWAPASPQPTVSRLEFPMEAGTPYAFRVTAVDAAGNTATSPVQILLAAPDPLGA